MPGGGCSRGSGWIEGPNPRRASSHCFHPQSLQAFQRCWGEAFLFGLHRDICSRGLHESIRAGRPPMAPRSQRTFRLLVCPSGASERAGLWMGSWSLLHGEDRMLPPPPAWSRHKACFHQLGRCLQTSLMPCWSPLKLPGGGGEPQGDPKAGSLKKIGEKERGRRKGGLQGNSPSLPLHLSASQRASS